MQVGKVHSTGGPGVKEAAKALLQENDPKKLATFLLAEQYIARNTDERVRAGQLLSSGGPEVKAAARIALSGSADELHTFIQHGQYQADSMDQLTATHLAQTTQLIAETARSAANARAQAWKAQQAAARARKAEDEANEAAAKAAESETQAFNFAAAANKSATDAEESAAKAAQSAATAPKP
ncbi:ALF repeat-containing protein [Streptomyces sp. McG3]|uniref:ALF repeat-containing protein n=1 Tax=Streptomyces sp. McG3 TaxID=2725483 RepID=UPI0027E45DF2|nr:ALF repeat-containing protein [Streptomyces sp. McG3]